MRTLLRVAALAFTLTFLASVVASGTAGARTASTKPARTTTTQQPTTTVAPPTPAPAPVPPGPAVGFNQQWDNTSNFELVLTAADLAKLKQTGATMVRLPVKCHNVGVCAYSARFTHSVDFRTATGWNFGQLESAVQHIRAAGMQPVISFAPGAYQDSPGYIVDDNVFGSFKAYTEKITTFLHSKFGPLLYSSYETEMDTSLETGSDGVRRYRYLRAAGFPARFATELSALYGGDIAALNSTYGTTYAAFSAVPVPDLGTSAAIPAAAFDSPATFDLRRIVAKVSAERFSEVGLNIDRLSPGSEYWGPTVQLQSLHDRREEHTTAELSPVGPTLSDLAAQPGIDALSIDAYRNDAAGIQAAEYRIAAKTAARHGKKVVIAEVGDTSLAALERGLGSVRSGASNLRAVLVWQAKDRIGDTVYYGMLDSSGAPKPGYLEAVTSLFSALSGDASRTSYTTGTEAVYYPEWALQIVQNGKLTTTKTLTAMADLMRSGKTIEPVTDAEIAAGVSKRLTIFSLYLRDDARRAIAASQSPAVAYQYASHRTGFSGGRAVDTALWPARNNFTVSAPETATRPEETVTVLGTPHAVSGVASLGGWPFVHVLTTGTNTTVAQHGIPAGYPLGFRSAAGSLWLDEYIGPSAIPALYG